MIETSLRYIGSREDLLEIPHLKTPQKIILFPDGEFFLKSARICGSRVLFDSQDQFKEVPKVIEVFDPKYILLFGKGPISLSFGDIPVRIPFEGTIMTDLYEYGSIKISGVDPKEIDGYIIIQGIENP